MNARQRLTATYGFCWTCGGPRASLFVHHHGTGDAYMDMVCLRRCGDRQEAGVECGRCGMPATGMALIDGVRYCHGDNDETPTCYIKASWRHPMSGEAG